ncbi:MAG: antibiotic biosynthesis monooxygenase [Gillisia sp.]
MKNLGLLATLKAKEGKEIEVANFIKGAVDLARREEKTITWYSFKIDPSTFGIFDTFENEEGREAHLNGTIAATLMEKAPDLLSEEPKIQKIDILSAV